MKSSLILLDPFFPKVSELSNESQTEAAHAHKHTGSKLVLDDASSFGTLLISS